MMKKIIALGGSNSKKSINKKLAVYTANQIENSEIMVIDLNDFKLPLYGIDLETNEGIPESAKNLYDFISSADGFIISLAEHNGGYSTAFKNALDWVSRIDKKMWKEKPMLLMAASPGPRGGKGVLKTALEAFPRLGGDIVADFSLPFFHNNFSETGLINEPLKTELSQKIKLLQKAL